MAQEFSKLLEDFKNEREKIKQAQELASKQLIEKLKAEEEERLQEIQEKNLMRLKEDEKLALIMQKEMEMVSWKYLALQKKNILLSNITQSISLIKFSIC